MVLTNSTTTPFPVVNGCVCVPEVQYGSTYNRLIAHMFSDCVYTERDYVGFFVGLSSLAFWIFAQAPQFITNCKNNSASALSVWFLAQWMFGDTVNLISTFLTNQISTVKITSILFVSMDVCLLGQYILLEGMCCCRREKSAEAGKMAAEDPLLHENSRGRANRYGSASAHKGSTGSGKKTALYSIFAPVLMFCSIFAMMGAPTGMIPRQVAVTGHGTNRHATLQEHGHVRRRRLLSTPGARPPQTNDPSTRSSFDAKHFYLFAGRGGPPAHRPPACNQDTQARWVEDLGVAFGWTSSAVYLLSRIPQILKNIKRGSVEGLSPIMFFCAVMGNMTYAAGILIRARTQEAVIKALPFLVGSVGTLCFDFTILLQFLYYKNKLPRRPRRLSKAKLTIDTGEDFESGGDRDGYVAIDNAKDPPRGLHNIVSWEASPWMSPEQIQSLRRESNQKVNGSMNGRSNTGYTPQQFKKKARKPATPRT